MLDSTILLYAKPGNINGEVKTEAWWVLDMKNEIEIAFTNEEEFLDYLKEKKGINNPEMIEIDKVWNQFKKEHYLPWFPDDYCDKKE